MKTKKCNHPAANVFTNIANSLYKSKIQPYKGKKKAERPDDYEAILQRIERNRKYAADINKRFENNPVKK